MQIEGDIVTSDGYQFEIDRTVPKIIDELGKVTEESLLVPIIRKITPTQGHTQINIKLDIVNKEGATITYSIQKEGEIQEKEKAENKIELEYTFNGLEIYTRYIITVEVTNEYGTRKKSITVETKKPTIQLSDSSLALKIDEMKQLTYTIIPNDINNKNVKWISSDSDIVMVDDNGKVTAKKEGKASITAMVEDGSYESETCTVKVVGPNYIVQNGKWEESIVGGWNSFVINPTSSFVQYQETYIDLLCSYANNRVGINSVNKIDVTDTEFITASIDLYSNCYNATTLTSSLYIGLCSNVDDTITNFERFDFKSTKANTVQKFELNFDTKDLKGDYYLKAVAVHGKEDSAYTVLGKVYDIIAWK